MAQILTIAPPPKNIEIQRKPGDDAAFRIWRDDEKIRTEFQHFSTFSAFYAADEKGHFCFVGRPCGK